MSLEKLTEVLKINKGSYYTVSIRNKQDLLLVYQISKSLGYICGQVYDLDFIMRYEKDVERFDTQVVCFYEDDIYDVYNHDCSATCLFDFTEEM